MEKICPVCGEKFTPKSGAQKYCSPKCSRAVQTKQNYDQIRKRSAIRSKMNPDLLFAFGCKCAVCGWSIPDWKPGYDKVYHSHGCAFHHIVPVCEGGTNTEENIVLLCPNCHTMAHAGLLTRDELSRLTFTKAQAAEMVIRRRLELSKEVCIDDMF